MNRSAGFTLVELITVILLLGILSAVAIARSPGSRDFQPRLFASTAAEQYRFARGLSTSRYQDPVTYAIAGTATNWTFTTSSSTSGEVRRETIANNEASLSVRNGTATTLVATGTQLLISFTPSGDLAAATLGTAALQPELGIELQIAGTSAHELCIHPTGYLRTGICE